MRVFQTRCLPLGQNITLGGRFSSDVSSYLTLKVKKCNSTANPHCISEANMTALEAALGEFTFIAGIINVVVNPSQPEYTQVTLEDRNFFSFSTTRAVSATGYVSELEVSTDQSLMPY